MLFALKKEGSHAIIYHFHFSRACWHRFWAIGSIAGLASLASYPALLLVGLPPVLANVTNTIALVFAGIGSTISSLKELHGHWKKVLLFIVLSLLGGIAGSLFLLLAPAASFEKSVPFFVLTAGILIIISSFRKIKTNTAKNNNRWISLLSLVGIFLAGSYDGYFGAGGGIIYLALLSLVVKDRFVTVNAMKNVIASAANLIATIIFIFKFNIAWLTVIPLGIGLLVGGYLGPIIIRHSNVHFLQILIAFASFGLAAYLFIKTYL